ncbi:MAG: hypothetical protein E5X49_25420, partial [Mesorhizobium sp.]
AQKAQAVQALRPLHPLEGLLELAKLVHRPGVYDFEVDTSRQDPAECARAIRQRLDYGPEPLAFRKLA